MCECKERIGGLKVLLCEETADLGSIVFRKSVTGQRSNQLNYVPNLFSYLYRKSA